MPSSQITSYSLLLQGPECTVCAKAPEKNRTSEAYQSEEKLEEELLAQLVGQGYDRIYPHSEADLVANLRVQIEKLNGFPFNDADWERFFREVIANKKEGIREKTRRIQQDPVIDFTLEDGTLRNVMLLDRNHIYKNSLQVMNQYEANEGTHKNRYDVTILVNGLPLVHIELKRRGVPIQEAFNQIERYQRESFWSESGLFEFVQVFVISNGTHTKYYSNTTRWEKTSGTAKKSSATFQFTNWWTDAENHSIQDLVPFAASFLSKGTLLMVLTHYCVFDVTESLLVMRPYQICACERILNRILISEYDKKKLGTLEAGGYVWHTTGSGKTLTSFKTAQLAAQMDGVDKVLFVVDRKDLDYQTMREYNRFQEGAVNGSRDTRALAQNLEAPLGQRKICVTTINKLSSYLKRPNTKSEVFSRHTVFIFDECHRSQFGEMHKAITKAFRNYHLFGFTGTPIFPENCPNGGNPDLRTTEQAFGDRLHTYTVVNAIGDQNVLPFKVDYISTFRRKSDGKDLDVKVEGIDTASAWQSPQRILNVATYILDHFDVKTKRRDPAYALRGVTRRGFNSILACDSVKSAQVYYQTLRKLIAEREDCNLRIATIFTYAANAAEDPSGNIGDEELDCAHMPAADREFLDSAIADYNAMFSTSYSTDGRGFDGYYKDVSRRMKGEGADGRPLPQSECLDLLIVVDMFLTGFDAKTLNTLWVDKNLRMHGLIQAFSRTNRILNSTKSFGNIVCFRNLQKNVDAAIGLFGDPEAGGIVILKPYQTYFEEYAKKLRHLLEDFSFDALAEPMGEAAERDFINTFSAILRLRNILTSFDQFANDDELNPLTLQDYQSWYLDLRDKYHNRDKGEKDSIADDLLFEMELVRQIEVNVDYILALVEQHHGNNVEDKEIAEKIRTSVLASPELRDKQDLIERFMELAGFGDAPAAFVIDPKASEEERHAIVSTQWTRFVSDSMRDELNAIITEERLKEQETWDLVQEAFTSGRIPQEGTAVAKILPPVSRFAKGNPQMEKRHRVTARLAEFFERFRSLTTGMPDREE